MTTGMHMVSHSQHEELNQTQSMTTETMGKQTSQHNQGRCKVMQMIQWSHASASIEPLLAMAHGMGYVCADGLAG